MLTDRIYMLAYPPVAQVAHQIRFAQRAVDLGQWKEFHVFESPKCPAVVITRYRTMTAIRDPHIDEWRDTYKETRVGALLARLSESEEGSR